MNMGFWVEICRRVLTSELSKRTGCREYNNYSDKRANILEYTKTPGYRGQRPVMRPKIEPFLPFIHEVFTRNRTAPCKQRHSDKRIFD